MEESLFQRLKATRFMAHVFNLRDNLKAIGDKRRALGRHSYVPRSVQVFGWKYVRIGDYSLLCEGTCINVNHPRPSVVIGSHCYIGRRNFISPGDLIEFGDYCLTTADCHFLGAGHARSNPLVPYLTAGVTDGGRIILGANCWLGCGVTVLGNVTIGFGSIIGARSLVLASIPPLCLAVGSPARVIKRFDVLSSQWIPAEQFTPDHAAALPTEQAYLAALRQSYPRLQGALRSTCTSFGDF